MIFKVKEFQTNYFDKNIKGQSTITSGENMYQYVLDEISKKEFYIKELANLKYYTEGNLNKEMALSISRFVGKYCESSFSIRKNRWETWKLMLNSNMLFPNASSFDSEPIIDFIEKFRGEYDESLDFIEGFKHPLVGNIKNIKNFIFSNGETRTLEEYGKTKPETIYSHMEIPTDKENGKDLTLGQTFSNIFNDQRIGKRYVHLSASSEESITYQNYYGLSRENLTIIDSGVKTVFYEKDIRNKIMEL